MDKQNLQQEYDKLEKEIDNRIDYTETLSNKLKVIGTKLQDIRLKSNSRLKNQKWLIAEVELMLKALNNFPYNDKLICNHFGVDSYSGIFRITLADKGNEREKLFVVIEVKDKWVAHSEVGMSKRAWDNIRKLFKRYGISSSWNGGNKHTSISFVLKKKIPESLRTALINYSNTNGFPKDTFEEVFLKNLKEVRMIR